MAEAKSLTMSEVVASAVSGEGFDFLRQAVELVCREIMEAEVSAEVGAGLGEQSPDRTTHRNG